MRTRPVGRPAVTPVGEGWSHGAGHPLRRPPRVTWPSPLAAPGPPTGRRARPVVAGWPRCAADLATAPGRPRPRAPGGPRTRPSLYARLRPPGAPGGRRQDPARPPDRRVGPLARSRATAHPAGLLATLEGGSAGPARRTLEAGPAPGRPARTPRPPCATGTLSGPKLAEITQAADGGPRRPRAACWPARPTEPLHVVKERCQRVRAAAADGDPVATLAADPRRADVHLVGPTPRGRSASRAGTAPSGGRSCWPDWSRWPTACRQDRRAAATGRADGPVTVPSPGLPDPTDPRVRGRPPGRRPASLLLYREPPSRPPPDRTHAAPPGGPGSAPRSPEAARPSRPTHRIPTPPSDRPPGDLGSVLDDLVTAGPPATVIVRVDLAALRRGRALPGELCEHRRPGPGPGPGRRRSLVDDAFVALCVHRGRRHPGRRPPRADHQPAPCGPALALRDRHCVVPGCGVAYCLEIDHVRPPRVRRRHTARTTWPCCAATTTGSRPTTGWTLERTGPTDEDPRWTFTPLATLRPGARPGARPARPADPAGPPVRRTARSSGDARSGPAARGGAPGLRLTPGGPDTTTRSAPRRSSG